MHKSYVIKDWTLPFDKYDQEDAMWIVHYQIFLHIEITSSTMPKAQRNHRIGILWESFFLNVDDISYFLLKSL